MSHKKSLIFASTLLLLLLPFVCCAVKINKTLPDNLSVARGCACNIKVGRFVSLDSAYNDETSASNNTQNTFAKEESGNLTLFTEAAGRYDIELKFLGVIPIKTMSVDVLDDDVVIPSGETIGIKIHTQGVLVVKLSNVETDEGQKKSPAKDAGIKPGDVIVKVDSAVVNNSDHFSALIDEKGLDGANLELLRDGQTINVHVSSALSGGQYKIGAWIRDSTAGIGTLTFIKPNTGVFGALGHGISDVDTGSLLSVSRGSITKCRVSSVQRGEKGSPGELRGVFASNDIGVIEQNSHIGLYGVLSTQDFSKKNPMKIATRFEVKTGNAKILATVDEQGPLEYDIEIEKVMTNSSDEKGMIIRITDERLLEKTGGIVQGMSGSPIIQDGKLVGAVTHVLINDPTRGYGIFIENMLAKAEK